MKTTLLRLYLGCSDLYEHLNYKVVRVFTFGSMDKSLAKIKNRKLGEACDLRIRESLTLFKRI